MHMVRAVTVVCWLSLWCHWLSSAGFQCAPSGTQRWHRQPISCSSTTAKNPLFWHNLENLRAAYQKLSIGAFARTFREQEKQVRSCYTHVLMSYWVRTVARLYFQWSRDLRSYIANIYIYVYVFLLEAFTWNPAILTDICWSRAFDTMESSVVHIYKEDRCPSGQPEECFPNFTLSEVYNYTPNGTWDAEPEPMSPIIPIIVAVYSVVFVVGLAGNCLVMYVIIRWVVRCQIMFMSHQK